MILSTRTVNLYLPGSLVNTTTLAVNRPEAVLQAEEVPADIQPVSSREVLAAGLEIGSALYRLFLNTDQADYISQGAFVEDGDKWYRVTGKPLVFDAGGAADHIEALLEPMDEAPEVFEEEPVDPNVLTLAINDVDELEVALLTETEPRNWPETGYILLTDTYPGGGHTEIVSYTAYEEREETWEFTIGERGMGGTTPAYFYAGYTTMTYQEAV